jgi:hypothetical protein
MIVTDTIDFPSGRFWDYPYLISDHLFVDVVDISKQQSDVVVGKVSETDAEVFHHAGDELR